MQRITGDHNIQAKRDVILQVINGLQSPSDIDQAITDIQKHHDQLLWEKGWLDFRIPLVILITFLGVAALKLWNLASIPLACICFLMLYGSVQLQKSLSRLDTEIAAASQILVEFYKIKLTRKISEREPDDK